MEVPKNVCARSSDAKRWTFTPSFKNLEHFSFSVFPGARKNIVVEFGIVVGTYVMRHKVNIEFFNLRGEYPKTRVRAIVTKEPFPGQSSECHHCGCGDEDAYESQDEKKVKIDGEYSGAGHDDTDDDEDEQVPKTWLTVFLSPQSILRWPSSERRSEEHSEKISPADDSDFEATDSDEREENFSSEKVEPSDDSYFEDTASDESEDYNKENDLQYDGIPLCPDYREQDASHPSSNVPCCQEYDVGEVLPCPQIAPYCADQRSEPIRHFNMNRFGENGFESSRSYNERRRSGRSRLNTARLKTTRFDARGFEPNTRFYF